MGGQPCMIVCPLSQGGTVGMVGWDGGDGGTALHDCLLI